MSQKQIQMNLKFMKQFLKEVFRLCIVDILGVQKLQSKRYLIQILLNNYQMKLTIN
ncbi:unnamed protein product [Paramecium sonneborni]|uniref:Uncharacterized protein n=1 Tax=Paramecium sonneborni TaxID=65129 RepID=A0A8S1NLX0_9CILI|nr:unnamed protein product [Paramecium sonneborni]